MRRTFGSTGGNGRESLRQLHTEEFQIKTLYQALLDRRNQWGFDRRYIECKNVVRISEGRPRRRWVNNIKMIQNKEFEVCTGFNWFDGASF
jgi:hypothetical protein